MLAQTLPEISKEARKEEYEAILSVFTSFLDSFDTNSDPLEALESLADLRSQFAIQHAIRGFGMEYEDAIDLVKRYDEDLSPEDKAKKEIIVAAIDNIIDFSVAEEYQMLMEVDEVELDDYDNEELEDMREWAFGVCKKYNDQYAYVENGDISYAMLVAAGLLAVQDEELLVYMTQGDERVRPWHMQYEGFTAPKSQFPRWLIPPIEHNCRCFLDTQSIVMASAGISDCVAESKPEWFNPSMLPYTHISP